MLKTLIKGLLTCGIIVLLLGCEDVWLHTYTKEATVIEQTANSTILKDSNNVTWTVNNTTFQNGDNVKLTIHTNYTDFDFNDDVIKYIKIIK